MSITIDTNTTTINDDSVQVPSSVGTLVLDVGLLFQPSLLIEQVRPLAAAAVGVTVSMSLDILDRAPLTDVSRRVLEASVESRLRCALHVAGYRWVTRRASSGSVVLDASA